MRPLGVVGLLLILCGAVVLVLRGVSYTKDRQTVQVGPIGLTAEQKGFVPPVVGFAAVIVGGVLLFTSRQRR
ncbi:MAG: DUF3185 domain-containing protein [Gemmatimonadaceae bacterium]